MALVASWTTGRRGRRWLSDISPDGTSSSNSNSNNNITSTTVIEETEAVVDLYQPAWAGILGLTLATLAVLLCVGSALFVYLNRNHPIVKVGQPPFLYLICFAALLMVAAVYCAVFDETSGLSQNGLSALCVAKIWFYTMGHVILFMALFCKLWRVEKVTQFRRGQRITVRQVMWPFVVVVTTAIGMLIAWTVVQPPYWVREIVIDLDDDDIANLFGNAKTFGYCATTGPFSTALAVLLLLSALIVLFMSCRLKNVPESISDSIRVRQTLLALLVLSIVWFAVALTATLLTVYSLFTVSGFMIDFLSSIFSIGFLIVPKIYYVWYERAKGHLPEGVYRVGGHVHVTGIDTTIAANVETNTTPTTRTTQQNVESTVPNSSLSLAHSTELALRLTEEQSDDVNEAANPDVEQRLDGSDTAGEACIEEQRPP